MPFTKSKQIIFFLYTLKQAKSLIIIGLNLKSINLSISLSPSGKEAKLLQSSRPFSVLSDTTLPPGKLVNKLFIAYS